MSEKNSLRNSYFILFSFFAFLLQTIRIILQIKCDGTFIYTSFTNVSHLVLGFWIFYACVVLCRCFPSIKESLSNSRILIFLDEYSFYIYLTHGLFYSGVYLLNLPLIVNTLLFLVLVCVATALLKFSIIGLERLSHIAKN